MNAAIEDTNPELGNEPRTTIRVTEVLDVAAAHRLASLLKRAPGASEVHIDLRPAREAHDAAVVALARALGGRRAVLLGLSRHQARLLEYVGEMIEWCR